MTGRMARVQELLRTRGEVCALEDLYGRALANGRNDIGTLRRHGWVIDSWLMRHDDDAPFHKHYRLMSEPGVASRQLALI